MKFLISLILISYSLLVNFQKGEIHLTIKETETNQGKIQILIFDNKEGYPSEIDKAYQKLSLPIQNNKASIILKDLAPGNYAIVVFHDEDMDGEIRKNKIGYPIDKFGFSNNPSLLFGVPSFERASIKVGNAPTEVLIQLR